MDKIYILAIAIVIAGALNGGVYSVGATGNAGSLIVNRFTGGGWYCGIIACTPLTFKNPN